MQVRNATLGAATFAQPEALNGNRPQTALKSGAADAASASQKCFFNPRPVPSWPPQGLPPRCPNPQGGVMADLAQKLMDLIAKLIGMLGGKSNGGVDAPGGGSGGVDDLRAPNVHRPRGDEMKDVGGRQAIPMDGPNGFLFKPVSDSDGKLAVLLPERMTGRAESVVIKDATGNVLDRGRFTGVGNGDREHLRFSKPGERYGQNVIVEITLKDGRKVQYQIPDPSKRHD